MRNLFILVFFLIALESQSQRVVLSKAYDTIHLAPIDSFYTLPIEIKESKIGATVRVSVQGLSTGTAIPGVDYILLGRDSLKEDPLNISVKQYKSNILLSIRSLDITKKAMLRFDADDGRKNTTIIPIVFEPYKKLVRQEPEKKDSILLELYKDVDVPVYNPTMIQRPRSIIQTLTKKKFIKDSVTNIENVSVEQEDGLVITIITADGKRYMSQEKFDVKGEFKDTDRVFLDGDPEKPYLKLKDFLKVSGTQRKPAKILTPQNRSITIEPIKRKQL